MLLFVSGCASTAGREPVLSVVGGPSEDSAIGSLISKPFALMENMWLEGETRFGLSLKIPL